MGGGALSILLKLHDLLQEALSIWGVAEQSHVCSVAVVVLGEVEIGCFPMVNRRSLKLGELGLL